MEATITDILNENFTVRDSRRVVSFLKAHFILTYFLAVARTNLREYFPVAPFFLEVVAEPEAGDADQLVLSVLADDPEEAQSALDRFGDEWWLEHMGDSDGYLCITLEFADE